MDTVVPLRKEKEKSKNNKKQRKVKEKKGKVKTKETIHGLTYYFISESAI